MEIIWINIASPWSLIFFVSVYAVGYFFIEIIWWDRYFWKKQLNDGNHISIKAMHYLFWGLPVSLFFAYFFIVKWDRQSLNDLLDSTSKLVIQFSPDWTMNWSVFWLIISIQFFYFVVIFLAISKFAFRLPYQLENAYFKHKVFFETKWLLLVWIGTIVAWAAFFILSHTFWMKEFLQNNYISKYLYIFENIAYYTFALFPISFYSLFRKIGFKNKISSTIWIMSIFLSLCLFFISIYWMKFSFINTFTTVVFGWDFLGNVTTGVYFIIVTVVFWLLTFIGYLMIKRASENTHNRQLVEQMAKSYATINKVRE